MSLAGGVMVGAIMVPAEYPSLSAGEESSAISISVSPAPTSSVTVVPSSPGLMFNPSHITLTNASPSCSFTVIAGDLICDQVVNYRLEGPDAANYRVPTRGRLKFNKRVGTFIVPEFPSVYVGQTSPSLVMEISKPPPTSVTILPQADGY